VQAAQAPTTATPSPLRPAITLIDFTFDLFTHRRVRVSSLPGLPFSGAPSRIFNFWPPSSEEAQSQALVPYVPASSSRAIARDDAMVVCTRHRLLVRIDSQRYEVHTASPPEPASP
jgi:hypothetical protein